ncbi:acetyl-CoA carboxylase biotin carboxyl carrier protein [Opitutaceae bacterium TAV4]|nr:acetyl-CoA carboxylase biotin carboxyl carrier protein [Opitutaceae bacterium TAV3]RRK01526.1 acetyl-CoA carboxylase biotin carboxyl carrier protein [Opitutaceae bacterium TAV4]
MKHSDLTEFSVEEEGLKLKICRSSGSTSAIPSGSAAPIPVLSVAPVQQPPGTASAPVPASDAFPSASPATDEAGVTYIKSPMVGTFYRAASPESKVFAEPGTKVVENSVVCIIEAMKIMNEIQAETKGTIIEALVENGQPVEYGQRLFKVKQG